MFPPDRIILILFALMFAGGTLDYLLGNRLGIGKKITEGLQAFAPLFLTMAGFIVLTPVLARISAPVIVPVFTAFGADPGLFFCFFLGVILCFFSVIFLALSIILCLLGVTLTVILGVILNFLSTFLRFLSTFLSTFSL